MKNKSVLSYVLSCVFSVALSVAAVSLALVGMLKLVVLFTDKVRVDYIGWTIAIVSLVCFVGIVVMRNAVRETLTHKRFPSKAKEALRWYERALILVYVLITVAVAVFGCLFLLPSVTQGGEEHVVVVYIVLGAVAALSLHLTFLASWGVVEQAVRLEVEKVHPECKDAAFEVDEVIDEGFMLLEHDGKQTPEGVFFCDDGEIRLNNPYHGSEAFYHQKLIFKAKVEGLLEVLTHSPYQAESINVFTQKFRGSKEGPNYMSRFVAVIKACGAQIYFTSDDEIGEQSVYHDESFNHGEWDRLQSRLEYYQPVELGL